MTDNKSKEIENIWAKYANTLALLNSALDKLEQQKNHYENVIADLKEQLKKQDSTKTSRTPNIDYWGRPKNPSKKLIDDLTYEQQTEQKFQRLVNEVKSGKLDINNLTHAEQDIVKRLLNE